MPTQPYEALLNRDVSGIKPLIESISPILQEAVNYATNLYQRCQTSKKGEPDEAYPVLASYLHIIQMTDSIEVLISNGCAEPANLLLRSSFEAKLAVAYLLEKDREKRAMAWMAKNIINQIEDLENYNQTHRKSEEFKTTVEQDRIREIAGLPPLPDVSDAILDLKESLKKPGYTEAYTEYTAMIKKGGKYPQWYSFYNGPKNLRELAQHLNQGTIYQNLYASWSKMSHVKDAAHLTFPLEDGTSVLGPIRNPMRTIHIGTMAFSILLEATLLMINNYRSYEESKFWNWYEKEVRDKHILLVRSESSQLKWYYEKFIQKK